MKRRQRNTFGDDGFSNGFMSIPREETKKRPGAKQDTVKMSKAMMAIPGSTQPVKQSHTKPFSGMN